MKIGVINIYRPPSSDTQSFEDILRQIRDWTDHTTKGLVLIGDLNFPNLHSWSESDRDRLRKQSRKKNKA